MAAVRTQQPRAFVRGRGPHPSRLLPDAQVTRLLQRARSRRPSGPRLRSRWPPQRSIARLSSNRPGRPGIPVRACLVHGRDQRRPGGPGNRSFADPNGDLRASGRPHPGIAARSAPTPHPPDGEPGTGPTIGFARSDLDDPLERDYASVLELAEACDVPVRWSCRTGVCHTCETTLIAGDVKYSPDPVEPPAEGSALICCSQPRDDLVLDL